MSIRNLGRTRCCGCSRVQQQRREGVGGGNNTPNRPTAVATSAQRRYSRGVLIQAACYSGSFYLTFIFTTVFRVYQLIAPTSVPPFAILYPTALLLPSEGFFNLLVYKRHQILKFIRGCKCKHEEKTQQNTQVLSQQKSELVENNNRVVEGDDVEEGHGENFGDNQT